MEEKENGNKKRSPHSQGERARLRIHATDLPAISEYSRTAAGQSCAWSSRPMAAVAAARDPTLPGRYYMTRDRTRSLHRPFEATVRVVSVAGWGRRQNGRAAAGQRG